MSVIVARALPDVRDPFLHGDPDRARGEVDDDVGTSPDLGQDAGKRLDPPLRAAFGRTGVDVHDRRARVGGTLRLLGDLDGGVRDRRTLVSRRQHAGQRGADDDRVARRGCHTGMLPCLRQGLSTFLPRACSIPLMITRRVSDGSITSSIIAQPAAR